MSWEKILVDMESSQELGKEKIESQNRSIKQDVIVDKDFYTSLEEIKDTYGTLKLLEEMGEDISVAKKIVEEKLTSLLSKAKKDKVITEEEVKNILGGILEQKEQKNNIK